MRKCTNGLVEHNSAMVQNFLEFGGGFIALMRGQIGFTSHVDGVQDGPLVITAPSEFIRRGGSETLNGPGSVPLAECKLCAEGRKKVDLHDGGFRKPLVQIGS